MADKELNMLLVDDDSVDVLSIKSAFEGQGVLNNIAVARDGVEGLEILRGEAGHNTVPRPFLILLDINMPRMNGIEFLKSLRADKTLHDSIVFVLTTSNDERDRAAAYDQHIAGYVVKSEAGLDFSNLVRLVEDFKTTVEFPLYSTYGK